MTSNVGSQVIAEYAQALRNASGDKGKFDAESLFLVPYALLHSFDACFTGTFINCELSRFA